MTGRLRTLFGVVALAFLIVPFTVPLTGPLDGQTFTAPIQLNGIGSYSEPRVAVGTGNGVAVLLHGIQDIYFTSALSGFSQPTLATMSTGVSAHGRLDVGSLFTSQVVYDEDTAIPGQSGKDIYLVSNTGGGFGTPVNVTATDAVDETFPGIAILGSGSIDITYQRQVGAGPSDIYVQRDTGTPVLVAAGQLPVIVEVNLTTTFIAYERGGSLYGRTFDGALLGPEEVIANDTMTHSDLEIAIDGAGNIHCAYLDGSELTYRRRNAGGGYSVEEVRDPGPVGPPSIAASPIGGIGIVCARTGQIHFHEFSSGAWSSVNLTPTIFSAAQPSVGLDEFGFAHVAYRSGTNIRYTTNVPAPTADFSAAGNNGTLPHTIAFTNLSTGNISSLLWDFGDGNTSTMPTPVHTYTTPGLRTVTLTVQGPGGVAVETKPNYISSTLPANVLRIPTLKVIPGQFVAHQVLADHDEAIQGFQVAVVFDEAVTPITTLSLDGSLTGGLGPDFIFVQVTPNGAQSELTSAILLETQEPFTGQLLPAANDQFIAAFHYTVPSTVLVGTTSDIVITDGLGTNNIFSPTQGPSLVPYPLHGGVEVVDPTGAALFVRGNANGSGNIDIADAVFVLTFLFAGGTPPPCPDAADPNDNGTVDIADAVNILTFLFAGTVTPRYPFPEPGLDPTDDNLGPCMPAP
ncbi:MAG: PKD domain-containing protein [Planctomycetota bacterium]